MTAPTPAGPIDFTDTGALTVGTPGVLRGLSVFDTSGAANTIRVYDAGSATGPLLASVTVAANAAADIDLGHGRRFATGLYVDCTDTVDGTAWVG